MKTSRGFTIVELLIVLLFLGVASWFVFVQKHEVEQAGRDSSRTLAVNAIYYNLENVFWTEHKYYPEKLQPKDLPGIDPNIFVDPRGQSWESEDSSYVYEGVHCTDGKCKSYTLKAVLEAQAEYIKKSNHN